MVQKIFSRMTITRIISQLCMVSLLEILMVEVCFSNGDRNVFNDDCDIRGKENCYFVVSNGTRFNWEDAHGKCKEKNSYLPIIQNREEQTAFETYLRRLKLKYSSITAVWTSGKTKMYKDWTWINGQALNTTISRVNDSAGETHAMIEYLHTGDITIKAANPWNHAWYLCRCKGHQCNGQHDVNAFLTYFIPSKYGNASWYEARKDCLLKHEDLAVLTDQKLTLLTKNKLPNPNYWIGLRKEYWVWENDRGSQATSEEEEVNYTNWKKEAMPTVGELCISIEVNDSHWRAKYCSNADSVVCEKRASTTTDSIPGMSSATATTARNSPTTTATKAATTSNHKDGSSVTATTAAAGNSLTTTDTNAATTVPAAIGAVVVIVILCIVVILVIIWRKSKSSNNNMEPKQTDSETTKDRKTKETPATTTTTTEERSIYADIPLAEKTANDAPEAGQKGTVYASLDFNHGVTYAEPSTLYAVTKNTQNVSSPIYAEPLNPTGNEITSAGSSPAVKTGPMGDVYALPMTNITPSSDKTTERPIYANT